MLFRIVHKHILVTGLMGSGKSTLLLEYMLNFKTIEFTKPSVEAKFQGQDFEFIDNVFAIRNNNNNNIYNFYELDAPTIKKWTQFISSADGLIIVSNQNPNRQFSTPKDLIDIILAQAPNTPLLFAASNYDDLEEAKKNIYSTYNLERIPHNNYAILGIGKGKEYFDEVYGKRHILEPGLLKNAIEWHLIRGNN